MFEVYVTKELVLFDTTLETPSDEEEIRLLSVEELLEVEVPV